MAPFLSLSLSLFFFFFFLPPKGPESTEQTPLTPLLRDVLLFPTTGFSLRGCTRKPITTRQLHPEQTPFGFVRATVSRLVYNDAPYRNSMFFLRTYPHEIFVHRGFMV